ncbi:MAG: putative leader peptide [Actinomycetes bacterium]
MRAGVSPDGLSRRRAVTIAPVSTELTRRRAVDLLRVATALCCAS